MKGTLAPVPGRRMKLWPGAKTGVRYMECRSPSKTFLKPQDCEPPQAIFHSRTMCRRKTPPWLPDCGMPERSCSAKLTWRNWRETTRAPIRCFPASTIPGIWTTPLAAALGAVRLPLLLDFLPWTWATTLPGPYGNLPTFAVCMD